MKRVRWTLRPSDVGFYDNHGRFVVENGRIHVYVGNTSSTTENHGSFVVTGGAVASRRHRR
jgi:beta-glucosidase